MIFLLVSSPASSVFWRIWENAEGEMRWNIKHMLNFISPHKSSNPCMFLSEVNPIYSWVSVHKIAISNMFHLGWIVSSKAQLFYSHLPLNNPGCSLTVTQLGLLLSKHASVIFNNGFDPKCTFLEGNVIRILWTVGWQ